MDKVGWEWEMDRWILVSEKLGNSAVMTSRGDVPIEVLSVWVLETRNISSGT